MFLWVTLPKEVDSLVFDIAIKHNVAFVPGQTFFADGGGSNTMRLNFTNSSDEEIENGIKLLGETINQLKNKLDYN